MRVAVAMSGGVDSSVVVKKMVDEGHEVVGLFLKLWTDPALQGATPCNLRQENRCCDYQALEDARLVASELKIPFYVINAEKVFKKEVVDYFLNEYKNLRTPNPCIVCNDKIKFDLLLKKALQLGCEKLATGHYARIEDLGNPKFQIPNSKQSSNHKAQNNLVIPAKAGIQELRISGSRIKSGMTNEGGFKLFAGVDQTKDQSYMLYRLNQDQLSKILFPLGEMTKKEVRALATKWKLPVHEKPESQEICFVAGKDYREFLKRYLPKKYFKAGEIVDRSGNIIGRHQGLVNYTVGQRKGIEQSVDSRSLIIDRQKIDNRSTTNDRRPLYVVGFDVEMNRLIVGEDKETYQKEMVLGDLSWIGNTSGMGSDSHEMGELRVKIRYRHLTVPINQISNIKYQKHKPKIKNSENKNTIQQYDNMTIEFKEPQRAVTPGQSAVFYLEDEVLGGGIIQ